MQWRHIERRMISLLKDLFSKWFDEKAVELVYVGMRNLWGHFKDYFWRYVMRRVARRGGGEVKERDIHKAGVSMRWRVLDEFGVLVGWDLGMVVSVLRRDIRGCGFHGVMGLLLHLVWVLEGRLHVIATVGEVRLALCLGEDSGMGS